MTQQLDLLGLPLDAAMTRRLCAHLPHTREVQHRRLPDVLAETPRAANTDPVTSHIAAERIRDSGALGEQQRIVLAAVKRWPGSTSAELAEYLALDRLCDRRRWKEQRPMVARRLPELAPMQVERRDVRACRVTGSKCVTWWPL